ncbi:MAG: hypothetical protein SFY66_04750 [Oculatellaceae cyanobacterium bins.114]|nr:hypothetical protein [Oculatellaceae cyanobacterium bins.114]
MLLHSAQSASPQPISGDRTGNTVRQARPITLRAGTTSIREWVGGGDRFDIYRFRLTIRSSLNLSLTGLNANADLALLNRTGKVIHRSTRLGRAKETIQQVLETGMYYIRVFARHAATRYRLVAVKTAIAADLPPSPVPPDSVIPTTPTPTPTPDPIPNPVPTSLFNIQFDYRFDTNQWFTPERRRVLEAAADLWETIVQDEFEAIAVGTRLNVINPQTGISVQLNADYEIDDLVVFVGARSFDGADGTLATGGPSGSWMVGSRLETRYQGADFEPWTASLGFDLAENWFFDPTPTTADDVPLSQPDFLTIALHELGHALGIGTSKAFDNWVSQGQFIGTHARAQNSGNPIPLTFDGHVQDGFIASNVGIEALMAPRFRFGTRQKQTRLDISFLEDIGYSVSYSSTL